MPLTARAFDPVPLDGQHLHNPLNVVALHFDYAVLNGATGATCSFKLFT